MSFFQSALRRSAASGGPESPAAQAIPQQLPKMFHKYVGNPHYFGFLRRYEERFPLIFYLNNAYYTAPLSKWGLTIVPLMGIMSGTPAPENVDVATSASIAATGLVWGVYATMIQPQNWGTFSFFAVQICCCTVNSYNLYRHWAYLQQASKAPVGTQP